MIRFRLSQIFFLLTFVFVILKVGILVDSAVIANSFFSPYLSHSLYLADIFFLLSLFFLGISGRVGAIFENFKNSLRKNLIFFILIFAFILVYTCSLFFSVNTANTLFYVLRIWEVFLFFILLVGKLVSYKNFLYMFLGVMFFESILGITQYFLQHSVDLWFFGEPEISVDMLGVAKVQLSPGTEFLRSYGTFSHPNVFGGYLVFATLMLIFNWEKFLKLKLLRYFLLIIFLVALVLTFSRTAMIALLLGLFIYLVFQRIRDYKKFILILAVTIVALALIFPSVLSRFIGRDIDSAISERALYLDTSLAYFKSYPLGIGAGNFTYLMQDFSDVKLAPWQYQPVHNIFMLIGNEIGVQGLIIFAALILFTFYKRLGDPNSQAIVLIVTLVLLGMADHYLISLFPGQFLFFYYLVNNIIPPTTSKDPRV